MKANTDGKPVILRLDGVPMMTTEQWETQRDRELAASRLMREEDETRRKELERAARTAVVMAMGDDRQRLNVLASLAELGDEAFTVAFESMRDTYRHTIRDGHEPGDFWAVVRGAMHDVQAPGESLAAVLMLSKALAADDRAFAFAMEGMHAAADSAVRSHYRNETPPPPSFAAILRPALRSA